MIILMKFSINCIFHHFDIFAIWLFALFTLPEIFKYSSLTLTQSNFSLFTGLENFQREEIQEIHSIMSILTFSMVKKDPS